MSIDLLLRALRNCEIEVTNFGWIDSEVGPLDKTEVKRFKGYARLAEKIHKKIVERFKRMEQVGKDLYLDKWVREQQENLRHLGEEM